MVWKKVRTHEKCDGGRYLLDLCSEGDEFVRRQKENRCDSDPVGSLEVHFLTGVLVGTDWRDYSNVEGQPPNEPVGKVLTLQLMNTLLD